MKQGPHTADLKCISANICDNSKLNIIVIGTDPWGGCVDYPPTMSFTASQLFSVKTTSRFNFKRATFLERTCPQITTARVCFTYTCFAQYAS